MTINNNQYGKIIERLRSEHGISQDTLANILLINTNTLQAVEKGTVQLSDSQLIYLMSQNLLWKMEK